MERSAPPSLECIRIGEIVVYNDDDRRASCSRQHQVRNVLHHPPIFTPDFTVKSTGATRKPFLSSISGDG